MADTTTDKSSTDTTITDDPDSVQKTLSNKNWDKLADDILTQVEYDLKKTIVKHLLKDGPDRKTRAILETGKENIKYEYIFQYVADSIRDLKENQNTVPNLHVVADVFDDLEAYRALSWYEIGEELVKQGHEQFAHIPLVHKEIAGHDIYDLFYDDVGQSVLKETLMLKGEGDALRTQEAIVPEAFRRGATALISAWASKRDADELQDAITPDMLVNVINNYDQKTASALVKAGYEPDIVDILCVQDIDSGSMNLAFHKSLVDLFNVEVKQYADRLYELALTDTHSIDITDYVDVQCYLDYLTYTHGLNPDKYIHKIPSDVQKPVKTWLEKNLSGNSYTAIII